jgi:tetratricopeptide (TPR) repeat protein
MGNYEEADPLHRRALEGREKALWFEHPDTLSSVNNLGVLLQDQGKDEEAEAMYRRALEAYQKTLGPEHTDTLACRKNLARSRNVLTTQSVEDPSVEDPSDGHPSDEETTTLPPKQNKPSTPAQKFLENHPLFGGSRSAQAVPRRDDLDEVD